MRTHWIAGVLAGICAMGGVEVRATHAQAAPAEKTPRVGRIMDIAAEPTLAGITYQHVTVDVNGMGAKQAIQVLSQASPLAVTIATTLPDMDDQPVTMHLKDAPFLEALMEFRHQSHTTLRTYTTDGITLAYATPEDGMPLWCVAGPFAVTLQGITREVQNPMPGGRGARGPAPQPTARATMQMGFLTEPGVNILQAMQAITFDVLEDDKKQAIVAQPSRNPGGLMGIQGQNVVVTLTLPESPGRRLPVVKGHVAATLAKTERVESKDLTTAFAQQINGMKVEIGPLTPRAGSTTFFTLVVKYTRGDFPQEKWADMAALLPKVKPTVSGKGRGGTINANAPGNGNRTGDTLQLNYTVTVPQAAGPAATFALDVPVEMKELQVPFEFRDLILP